MWTRRAWLGALGGVVLGGVTRTAAGRQATPAPNGPLLYLFSNSSPHVSVIDPATRRVVQTVDLDPFTAWSWNDDNNYCDGRRLWLGLRDPDTAESEVIAFDLATLTVDHRFALGPEPLTLYIGKATATGRLLVGKMGAGQVVAIDTRAGVASAPWQVPVNGDVVCDADVTTDATGRERFVYPTRNGDTLVTLDPATGEVTAEVASPPGTIPFMLTTAPDGRIWVQESGDNTNAVYDPALNLVGRFPTGRAPINATFSADGRYAFIGHNDDTIVQVVERATFAEVARIEVGVNPQRLAVHPDGTAIYAGLTREAAVVVIATDRWEVVARLPLGTEPNGIFVWSP